MSVFSQAASFIIFTDFMHRSSMEERGIWKAGSEIDDEMFRNAE